MNLETLTAGYPRPGLLCGKLVQLEPLIEDHRDDLRRAAAIDQSIWTYFPMGFNGAGDDFDLWFDYSMELNARGQHFPFAVKRHADNAIVGTTRLYDMNALHRRLAIGSTWYRPDARGGIINFEVRLLLLKHVFGELAVNRVEFITDPRNLASQAAMKLLGVVAEGRIRNHLIYKDGRIRDSLLFSIVRSEWPGIEARLVARLARNCIKSSE